MDALIKLFGNMAGVLFAVALLLAAAAAAIVTTAGAILAWRWFWAVVVQG